MPSGVEVVLPAVLAAEPVDEAPLRMPVASRPSNSLRSWLTVVLLGFARSLAAGLAAVLRCSGVEVPDAGADEVAAAFFAAKQKEDV